MYIIVCLVILVAGIALLIMTSKLRTMVHLKFELFVLGILGVICICIGIYAIFLVLSGEITLPLIKK